MKKILIIFIFIILLLEVFANEYCTSSDEQCLKITKFVIKNSADQETTDFAAGDTLYVDMLVKNIGTKKVENGQVYIHTRATHGGEFSSTNYLMPGGNTNLWLSGSQGIDIDTGKEIPFLGVEIPTSEYSPPTEYQILPFVRTQSGKNLEYQDFRINLSNEREDWIAAQAVKMVVCEPGTDTCAHRLEKDYSDGDTSNDLFDLKVDVQNKNTQRDSYIRVYIHPRWQIKGCDRYPQDYSGAGLDKKYTFKPGETKSFEFYNCEFKDELKTVERAFQVVVNNGYDYTYLHGGWPGTRPAATPLVHNDNLWADKDYLAKGEKVKLESKFYIFNHPIKMGSKAVFTIYNVKNANGDSVTVDPLEYFFTQEQIDKTGGWNLLTAIVELDSYNNDLPAPKFSIRFDVYDDQGNIVNRNYRVNVVHYSPPIPREIDLASFEPGEHQVEVDAGTGFNQVVFTNADVQSTDKISVEGASGYGSSVIDGKAIYYFNVPTNTTVTFTIIVPEVVEIVDATGGLFEQSITANTENNQILLKPGEYKPSDIVVEGAEEYTVEMVEDGYLINYSVANHPSDVTLSLAIEEAAPAPGIILSAIVILVGISFLVLYLNRTE